MDYQIKEIKDYPGYYIDTDGDVWSSWKAGGRKRIKTNLHKLTKFFRNPHYPYYTITMNNGKGQKSFNIHRLLAEHFLIQKEGKTFVCHKDGNSLNNSLSNLYWGSPQDNSDDRVCHGKAPKGENNKRSKLKEWQVKFAKKCLLLGIKQSKIAKVFNVHKTTIHLIAAKKNWKDLTCGWEQYFNTIQ